MEIIVDLTASKPGIGDRNVILLRTGQSRHRRRGREKTEEEGGEEEMTKAPEEKTAGCDKGSKRKQPSESGTGSPSIGESGPGEPSSTESSSSKRCRPDCSSCEPSSSKSASEESSSSDGSSPGWGEEMWRQSLVQHGHSSTSSESSGPHSALESVPRESCSSQRSSDSVEHTMQEGLVRYGLPSSISTIESVSKESSSGSSPSGCSSSDSAGETWPWMLSRCSPSDSSDPESDSGSE